MFIRRMAVVVSVLFARSLSGQTVSLRATPSRLQVGDSAIVSWDIAPASSAFLSAVGLVPASGRMAVRPGQSVSYVLVVEGPNGVIVREVAVAVTGARGDDEFPDRSDFRSPFSYRQPEPSLPTFLVRVRDILQNDLRHSVRAYDETDGSVFETNRRERADLVGPAEDNIGARRIAYRLTVRKRARPADPLEYTVQTFVQYRLLRERTWRVETDPALHEAPVRVLAQRLNQAAWPGRPGTP